jgi:hypothetical protein
MCKTHARASTWDNTLWDNTLLVNRVKRAHLLISCAWLVHAAAWFLPVIKEGSIPQRLPGWEAFRAAFSAVWPFEGLKFAGWYYAVIGTVSAVTTLLFLFCSPWVVLRGSRSLWRASAWAAATASVVNALWFSLDVRIGYFLWWLSFVLLAIGLFDLVGWHRTGE